MRTEEVSKKRLERRASSFGYRVSTLFRMVRSLTQEEMTELGLKTCLIPFLAELFHEDGIPQEELADRMFVDKGSTARALARLEQDGLVFRIQNRENRRQKLVYLTDKAALLEERFFAVLGKETRTMTRGLTPAEQETAMQLIDRMIANLREELRGSEQ